MSQISFCVPNATTCLSLRLLSAREYFKGFTWSNGATQGKLPIHPFTLQILTLPEPARGPPAGTPGLGPQSSAMMATQGADTASRCWTELQGRICILSICTTAKEQVKSLVNTPVISKREASLIYITISKHAEKGCHLRDLMFPDSKELAFTHWDAVHIYQGKVLAQGL